MGLPKSVIRFDKNGVKFISNVDRAQYTIQELTRAAMRDVGKLVCRYVNQLAMQLPGLKKSRRVRGGTSAFQYWARKQECDLQVGIKHNTWYGVEQELGSSKMKKHGFLRNTVYDHIPEIVEIESKYLSAMESEAEALKLIESENDYEGGADDD